MPRVSAWFVRASLCHLVGGFTIGALLLASKGIGGGATCCAPTLPLGAGLWVLRGAHIEMLLVGWVIQMVMGVAIWILPRFAVRNAPERSALTAWLAFALLNAGVVLVSLGGGLLVAGRLVEIGAAVSFAAHLWGRVSPAGLSAI